ncbi:MAG: flagellar hook-length control protein FliK [Desulfatitalea sp.]
MKFFEVLPKGMGQGAGLQKVAIKMPGECDSDSGADSNGFADVMAALMSMPAEQLSQSLKQFDRVCTEGQSKEWVPLIDLTQVDATGNPMLKLLQGASQEGGDAATLFQMKLQQILAQNAQPQAAAGNALEPKQTALDGLPAEGEQTPGQTAQAKLDALFAAGEKDLDGAQPLTPVKDASATFLARAFAEQKGGASEEPSPASIPAMALKADATKPVSANEIASQVSENTTTIKTPLTQEIEKHLGGSAQRMPAVPKAPGAAPKAAQVAVSKTAASTAKSDSVDMGASIDKALANQRPISKGDAQVGNADVQAKAETKVATATPPSASASSEPLQSVDTRLSAAETRPVQRAKESAEAQPASKEMQSDVIRQVVQRMTLHSDGRTSSMQIKLKPEFLGNLRMEVVAENQQIMVRMTAENQTVKGIIEQNLHVLKAELQQHGLQIQKFDVYVAQDDDQWRDGQQQAAFRQPQDRGHRQGASRDSDLPLTEENVTVDGSAAPKRAYGDRSAVDFFA